VFALSDHSGAKEVTFHFCILTPAVKRTHCWFDASATGAKLSANLLLNRSGYQTAMAELVPLAMDRHGPPWRFHPLDFAHARSNGVL
jgi:hypothetical protein